LGEIRVPYGLGEIRVPYGLNQGMTMTTVHRDCHNK